MKHLFITWIIWNLIVFFMMGIDKWKAKRQKRRISEKTLLLSCLCMGAIGGGTGMLVFHHKTRKRKFQILVPLTLVINAAVLFAVFYFSGFYIGISGL